MQQGTLAEWDYALIFSSSEISLPHNLDANHIGILKSMVGHGRRNKTTCISLLEIALATTLEPDFKLRINYIPRCYKTEPCAYWFRNIGQWTQIVLCISPSKSNAD